MFRQMVSSSSALLAVLVVACSTTVRQPASAPANSGQRSNTYCAGVPDQSASASLLARPALVEAVYEDNEQEQVDNNSGSPVTGAKIMLRPEPGISRSMLGRALHCRIARGMLTGLANNDTDPLTVGIVRVHVAETSTGYMVDVRSENEEDAREIVRRANNLLVRTVAQSEVSTEAPRVSVR